MCILNNNRSCLDGNKSFLTTADSAVKLVTDATRPVLGWKGLEYKVAFPVIKPPGANFYPPDMDKKVNYSAIFLLTKSTKFPQGLLLGTAAIPKLVKKGMMNVSFLKIKRK